MTARRPVVMVSGVPQELPSGDTITPLPIGDVTGLGSGVGTFLATPSSANLISAMTDETGTGALVFANTPTLVTPAIGVATGTSLALNGATLGTNKLAVTGSLLVVSGSGMTVRNGSTDGFTWSQSNTNSWIFSGLSAGMWFTFQNTHVNIANGRLGVGVAATTDPTAQIEMAVANTTTVPAIRFKTASAALLTTPLSGAFETDGTDLYFTNNAGTRKKVTIV